MKIGLLLLLGAVVLGHSATAEGGRVVINEIMASNGTTLADENGDYPDWIELANLGSDPVVLDGWGLSDDPHRPFKWVFRDASLAPGEFLTIFASGKDRQPEDPAPRAPTEIPGLRLWLSALEVDPSDPEQVRPREDGKAYVRRWLDLSGEGNHAFQRDEARQPTWLSSASGGAPALRFDGVNDQLVLPRVLATNDFSLWAVYRTTESHWIDQELFEGSSGTRDQRYLFGARSGGSVNAGAGVSVGTNGVSVYEHGNSYLPALAVAQRAPGADYVVLAVNYDAQRPSIDLQGLLAHTGLPSPRPEVHAPTQIGSGSFGAFAGELVEVVMFNRALQANDRRALAAYLGHRHAIDLPRFRHTSFRLGGQGDELYLTRPEGTRVDSLRFGPVTRDVSYGRHPDGIDEWHFFTEPTPGAANDTTPLGAPVVPPSFSHAGGFYSEPIALTLSSADPEATLYYTLDGSVPDPAELGGRTYTYKNEYPEDPGDPFGPWRADSCQTLVYADPIAIADRSAQPDRLTGRSTTWHRSPEGYTPTDPVFKGTVVRARAFKAGALPSEVITHTFFVTPEGRSRYTLPVISFSLDEEWLFGYERGVYCAGIDYDSWRLANPDDNGGWRDPVRPANYHRSGRAWEYPVNLELFATAGQPGFNAHAGFRIHGRDSRSAHQKSFRLYARTQDDSSTVLNHAFFPEATRGIDGSRPEQFERLLVHSAMKFYDVIAHQVMSPAALEVQRSRPVASFFNGEFWGLSYLRDKQDEYHLASEYLLEPDNIIILNAPVGPGRGTDVEVGDPRDILLYRKMFEYATQADPGSDLYYYQISSWLDLDSYFDFNVMYLYLNNPSWQGAQHFRFWRVRHPRGQPYADGKWRMMVWDLEWFIHDPAYDFLRSALDPAGEAYEAWARFGGDPTRTLLLRSLLRNSKVRDHFIQRFALHMNSTLRPERIARVAAIEAGHVEAELPEHAARFRHLWPSMLGHARNWEWYGRARPGPMRDHLRKHLSAGPDREVVLHVADPAGGHLRIDGLEVLPGTAGVADEPYPWKGTYFGNVPITVTAVPAQGYRFVGWEEYPDTTRATIELLPSEDLSLTARFEIPSGPDPATLLHYWSFNDPGDLLAPAHTISDAAMWVDLGPHSEVVAGSGQDFMGENAQGGDLAETHLRLNYPLDAILTLQLPTVGFERIVLRYETRRSGQGAGIQHLAYTVNGADYLPFASVIVRDGSPALQTLDLSEIPGANNNPRFGLRVTFAQGSGGLAGNNRFDNLTVEGQPFEQTNQPPFPVAARPRLELVASHPPVVLELDHLFHDPDGDPLIFLAQSSRPEVVELTLSANLLQIRPRRAGESLVTVSAYDGRHHPVPMAFRVLVYPAPHPLGERDFEFSGWNLHRVAGSYPPHMIFEQTSTADPGLDSELDSFWALPYDLTSRSRVNGLDELGVSFLNTSNAQDLPGAGFLGSALLALRTTGVNEVWVSWTGGTVRPNDRVYALRLQVRVGNTGPWADVLDETGEPVEYVRHPEAGHQQHFRPTRLPAGTTGQDYVQVRWKYYHVSGNDGPRAQLRLDGLRLETVRRPEVQLLDPMQLNRQTGLFEQTVAVINPGDTVLEGVRLIVRNLPRGARVQNALARPDGSYVVRLDRPLAPGASALFELEFYLPDRQPLAEVEWAADTSLPLDVPWPQPSLLEIDRQLPLPDGRFLVEFMTQTDHTYRVQYTEDLVTWKTAEPAVAGTGSRIHWIDGGPPKTDRHPAEGPGRFYRLLEFDSGSAPHTP
jgi:hypothetical protein